MTPQRILAENPMGRRQWTAVALAIFLNGLDGYDAASISFAAPGIAESWGLDPAALGWVLSMELIGMAVGSLAFGMAADRFGRRPCILTCLILMASGMLGATFSQDVLQLSTARILTGLGIGGMLASLTAIVSEYANDRWRPVVISTMIVGYPLGSVLGGLVARHLLVVGEWHDVFLFGAIVTIIALPLALALIPESPIWAGRQSVGEGLRRANKILAKFGLPSAEETEAGGMTGGSASLAALFRGPLARVTILLTLAYVGHMTCYYFILKWMPKLVVDFGYEAQIGADMLIVAMLAGSFAGPVFGFVASRITLPLASIIVLLGAALAVNVFAQVGTDRLALIGASALVGVFFNSGGVAFLRAPRRSFSCGTARTWYRLRSGRGKSGRSFRSRWCGGTFRFGLQPCIDRFHYESRLVRFSACRVSALPSKETFAESNGDLRLLRAIPDSCPLGAGE